MKGFGVYSLHYSSTKEATKNSIGNHVGPHIIPECRLSSYRDPVYDVAKILACKGFGTFG